MINEHLDKTIDLLVKDSKFLTDFDEKLEGFNSPDITKEEQAQMIKNAGMWVLHVIDYYVTFNLIDMEADLSRLCRKDPKMASKFRDKLNEAAISMKNNYQYLCKEGTIYSDGIGLFVPLYAFALKMVLNPKQFDFSTPKPFFAFSYPEVEFISAGEDKYIIERKFQELRKIDFSVDAINEFISTCFHWADKIEETLQRMHSYLTIADIDVQKLERVFMYCKVFTFKDSLTFEKFAAAIRNIEKPQYCIIHADSFYALVLALYNTMGSLSSRDKWLTSVIKNFELESSNYYNAKKRIENKATAKLCERYNEIKKLLEE